MNDSTGTVHQNRGMLGRNHGSVLMAGGTLDVNERQGRVRQSGGVIFWNKGDVWQSGGTVDVNDGVIYQEGGRGLVIRETERGEVFRREGGEGVAELD